MQDCSNLNIVALGVLCGVHEELNETYCMNPGSD